MLSKSNLLRIGLLLASVLTLNLFSVQANASNSQPYEPRLTSTFSEVIAGSGSSRTITVTASVIDSDGLLVSGTPTGNQIKVWGLVLAMCSTQQPSSKVGIALPSGCQGKGFDSSGTSIAGGFSFSLTLSGSSFDAEVANGKPYLTPILQFEQAGASTGLSVMGSSATAPLASTPVATSSPSPAPQYSGPEFSSFGSATLAGSKLVTSGKKLDSITSMKINGMAVTYKINSASELEIDLPKDLAPGKYDVEINSIHGKLTHLQGITIKAVVPTKELAFKAEGAWLNYGSLLELTNIAKQIGSEYTSVKCIVNAADPVVAERLAKRACSYIEANRLRGKAVTYESKSTFKGDGFWVRILANG